MRYMYEPLDYAQDDASSEDWRRRTARWLVVVGIAMLASSVVLLVILWGMAWWQAELPGGAEKQAMHGPWRHHSGLRSGLSWAIVFPVAAGGLCLLSLLFRVSRLAAAGLGAAVVWFFALALTHLWLID
jgi:hypothetical protein